MHDVHLLKEANLKTTMCCLIITKQYAGRGKKKPKHGEYKKSMLSKG